MSILSEEEKLDLIQKAKDYDYIRFSWPDLNGITRGKTVIGRYAENAIRNGISAFPGILTFSPRCDLTDLPVFRDSGYGNCNYVPATKIYDLAWASKTEYKIGKIICEAFWEDGTPIIAHPRTAAKRQIERLDAMGFKLYSAFEVEFFVVDAYSLKPVFDGLHFGIDLKLSEQSKWFYDLEKQLASLNINIEAIHAEYGPGQFEFSMIPKYGLDVFDDIFLMKDAMKEILLEHGVKPTFMTRPFASEGCSSGFHFNHSLWNKNGESAFYDASKPLNMSDTYRYWIGGLIKHMDPLAVLCSPTPNCYRRLGQPWAPGKADWGIDNRLTALRVKTSSPNGSYIENRLPSSACNPYIVAAATIAAGLDGIENKIEPPEMGLQDSSPAIPPYEDCVKALQEDKVLVEALGKEFVEWWVAMKKHEIKRYAGITLDSLKEEELAKERKDYFDQI